VLRASDIACFVADWRPKAESLVRIADTLNVGLESVVFIDDNPLERELVRATLPDVRVVDLPADPALYAAAVAGSRHFAALTLTSEDRSRTASYRADAERRTVLEEPARTLDDLIASLQ